MITESQNVDKSCKKNRNQISDINANHQYHLRCVKENLTATGKREKCQRESTLPIYKSILGLERLFQTQRWEKIITNGALGTILQSTKRNGLLKVENRSISLKGTYYTKHKIIHESICFCP